MRLKKVVLALLFALSFNTLAAEINEDGSEIQRHTLVVVPSDPVESIVNHVYNIVNSNQLSPLIAPAVSFGVMLWDSTFSDLDPGLSIVHAAATGFFAECGVRIFRWACQSELES